MATVIGWALLSVAILSLLHVARLDRRLHRHRAPGIPAAAYLGPVGRWKRERYTADGQVLIGPTRLAFAVFCVAALLGALLLG